MARGGKRTGAGRKPGTVTEKTQGIAAKAMSEGITPLEVMLAVMRINYEKKEFEKAASIAKDAAPYMHPRIAPVEPKKDKDLDKDEILRAVAEALDSVDSAPGTDGVG